MQKLLTLAASGVLALAWGIPIQAQAEAAQEIIRYPWDHRPNRCFIEQGDAPGNPQCVANHWPTYEETASRVRGLFHEPHYDLIHRAEQELGFSKEKFPTGEYYFEAWYLAMYDIFRREPGLGETIAGAWRRARGREGYVELAEALITYGQGWEARGGGYAGTVSGEQWGLYHKKLEKADALLNSASQKLKDTAPWYALKLEITLQHTKLKPQASGIFNKATDLWPTYVRLYNNRMSMSFPRWGGTFADMEQIARIAANKNKQDSAAMYARVYEQTFREDRQYTLPQSAVDWNLMKQGMRELESYPLSAWEWENFARLACQMKDRAEARERFILADVQPDTRRIAPRDYQHECREFANGSDAAE